MNDSKSKLTSDQKSTSKVDPKNSVSGALETEWVDLKNTIVSYSNYYRGHVSAHSKIGRRKYQEDRFVVCPKILGKDTQQFYGVFDGTVGDYTADYVHTTFVLNFLCSGSYISSTKVFGEVDPKTYVEAMKEAYIRTEYDLIERSRKDNVCYSASTSATVFLHDNYITVGHLADSLVALGSLDDNGYLKGRNLTIEHKPDQPAELERIVSMGGSLTYLHGGKPFLRGGDFTERLIRGDRPMQLNYSRAFGAKDLKPYGLSSIPDISQFKRTEKDRYLVIGSDGLWDVIDAQKAVIMAHDAYLKGLNPAEYLTDSALQMRDMLGLIDNVTVIVVQL